MKEYKREKGLLETQVTEMSKRSTYHDDHLRVVDIWFTHVGAYLFSIRSLSLNRSFHSYSTKSWYLQMMSILLVFQILVGIFEQTNHWPNNKQG